MGAERNPDAICLRCQRRKAYCQCANHDPDVLPIHGHMERSNLPEADDLSSEQYGDALVRLNEDTRAYPQFPWPALADVAGPMCPEDLIMVMARTGNGKSLFLQNLFDAMITAGRCGLYVGLEQHPKILRVKWACIRAGINPRLVLAPRPEEYDTAAHRQAKAAIEDELAWQLRAPIREAAMFSAARMINARGLKEWTEWAVDRGAQFLVLDHIDRIRHGEGKNPFQEMSDTMRLAKELATKHSLVMLVASQVGRPGDALESFMPPQLHNARGGGTKEEESDTVLGVYRPLKPETTEQDMKRVRQGFASAESIIESHQMGVRVLKHRLDGAVHGKIVRLAVNHGRVTDLPERDQFGTTYDAMKRI